MANYKNTVGKPIKFLSSNLDNSEGGGQIWYNSSDENFKIMPALNAWSSGGSLTTPKYEMSGFGTQTAAVMAAGRTTAASTDVQEYNGTGYTSASNYPIAMRNGTGCGTETAGLVFGGRGDTPTTGNNAPVSVTAEYDGSSWTVGGSMGAGRYGLGAAGSQTAAVGLPDMLLIIHPLLLLLVIQIEQKNITELLGLQEIPWELQDIELQVTELKQQL